MKFKNKNLGPVILVSVAIIAAGVIALRGEKQPEVGSPAALPSEQSVAESVAPSHDTLQYNYDPAVYTFIGVDDSATHWLFWKKVGGFTLLDAEGNTIVANLDAPYTRKPLYDQANDGFVFFKITWVGTESWARIDFLSLEDLSFRTILITEPIETPGRGCYTEELVSVPGEVIIHNGCMTVDSKYRGSDGNIHIRL